MFKGPEQAAHRKRNRQYAHKYAYVHMYIYGYICVTHTPLSH